MFWYTHSRVIKNCQYMNHPNSIPVAIKPGTKHVTGVIETEEFGDVTVQFCLNCAEVLGIFPSETI